MSVHFLETPFMCDLQLSSLLQFMSLVQLLAQSFTQLPFPFSAPPPTPLEAAFLHNSPAVLFALFLFKNVWSFPKFLCLSGFFPPSEQLS